MATEINITEVYFEWWLNELKARGLVLHWEREPKSFVITEPVQIFYNQFKATKEIIKSWELYPALTYTPDYKVIFSEKLKNKMFGVVSKEFLNDDDFKEMGSVYQNTIFYVNESKKSKEFPGCYELWFDVKPPTVAVQRSGQLGSSRDFKYVSRFMYEKYEIIVNKVVPVGMKTSLFGKTFLPKRYLFTDVSGGIRKLKDYESNFRNLDKYLEIKKIY